MVCQLLSCGKNQQSGKAEILWKDQKAYAITFPISFAKSISKDLIVKRTEIRLAGDKSIAILGDFFIEKDEVLFTPLIPFTRGLTYKIWIEGKEIDSFRIPVSKSAVSPAILRIYPSADTLPENLLKVYLHFSKPMREGQSGKYVMLIRNNSDTIKGAFLDLQPELWNPERTILTLWLDPGRIKRDLQPNKKFGAPLQKDSSYKIVVSKEWEDELGNNLTESFIKKFVTMERDSLSPDPDKWKILTPKSTTLQILEIEAAESLDQSLLMETLSIKNHKGEAVTGKWQTSNKERNVQFQPDRPWKAGDYILHIETKLEDLAGNNLNRLFDRDVTKSSKVNIKSDLSNVRFNIRN